MSQNVYAPFSPEQIESLNKYQKAGMVHPFTCGVDSDHPNLLATKDGWICTQPACKYTQNYAFGPMADGSWEAPMLLMQRIFSGTASEQDYEDAEITPTQRKTLKSSKS